MKDIVPDPIQNQQDGAGLALSAAPEGRKNTR